MKFSHPHLFYLIWLVILMAGVTGYGLRKRDRILSRFVAPTMVSDMAPGAGSRRRWVKGMLRVSCLFLAVLALTGPLVGFRWEKIEQEGVDIMLALDCSRSMLASDINPSRLVRAKREIIDLLKRMRSDRAGLVAFSGSAILQCPLTLDHSAFSMFLDALDPDYLPMGGTDIGGAIDTALNGFEWEIASEKAIILITDGEDTTGDPRAVADRAAEKGVRIFCIGVGGSTGAPIPDPGGGFKKDASGHIIMSRVDDDMLETIAHRAGGIYVKSVAGDMDLERIYTNEILKNMDRTLLESGRKKVWENRFQWVLLPCVLLLILELMLSEKKKRPPPARIASLIVILGSFLVMMSVAPPVVHASASRSVKKGIEAYGQGQWEAAESFFIDAQLQRPELPEIYYNIGTAAYKKGDYAAALAHYAKAMETDDPRLRDRAAFNLGNTRFRMGDLEGAISTYETIPEDSFLFEKASENMAVARQRLEAQKKQEQQEEGAPKNQDQQEPQQKKQEQKNGKNGAEKETSKQEPKNQKPLNQKPLNQNQNPEEGEPSSQNQNPEQEEQNTSNQDRQPEKNGAVNPSPEQEKSEATNPSQAQEQEPGTSLSRNQDQAKGEALRRAQAQKKTQEPTQGADGTATLLPHQQQMLDRLVDQPGRALMPAYSGAEVERDW